MIAAIFFGLIAWALLFVAIKAFRARILDGWFVAVCLAVLFAQACADAFIRHALFTAVEAASR